jgi:hypothetical protein
MTDETLQTRFPCTCVICGRQILNEEAFKKHVDEHVAKIMADVLVKAKRKGKTINKQTKKY